ncbi:hypothetical protein WA158_000241 [Blastocystis sp. Blastoise]
MKDSNNYLKDEDAWFVDFDSNSFRIPYNYLTRSLQFEDFEDITEIETLYSCMKIFFNNEDMLKTIIAFGASSFSLYCSNNHIITQIIPKENLNLINCEIADLINIDDSIQITMNKFLNKQYNSIQLLLSSKFPQLFPYLQSVQLMLNEDDDNYYSNNNITITYEKKNDNLDSNSHYVIDTINFYIHSDFYPDFLFPSLSSLQDQSIHQFNFDILPEHFNQITQYLKTKKYEHITNLDITSLDLPTLSTMVFHDYMKDPCFSNITQLSLKLLHEYSVDSYTYNYLFPILNENYYPLLETLIFHDIISPIPSFPSIFFPPNVITNLKHLKTIIFKDMVINRSLASFLEYIYNDTTWTVVLDRYLCGGDDYIPILEILFLLSQSKRLVIKSNLILNYYSISDELTNKLKNILLNSLQGTIQSINVFCYSSCYPILAYILQNIPIQSINNLYINFPESIESLDTIYNTISTDTYINIQSIHSLSITFSTLSESFLKIIKHLFSILLINICQKLTINQQISYVTNNSIETIKFEEILFSLCSPLTTKSLNSLSVNYNMNDCYDIQSLSALNQPIPYLQTLYLSRASISIPFLQSLQDQLLANYLPSLNTIQFEFITLTQECFQFLGEMIQHKCLYNIKKLMIILCCPFSFSSLIPAVKYITKENMPYLNYIQLGDFITNSIYCDKQSLIYNQINSIVDNYESTNTVNNDTIFITSIYSVPH